VRKPTGPSPFLLEPLMKTPVIPESEWKWFGLAGHLIVGRWCRFHMATQVGRVLVSTVGQYMPPEGLMRSFLELRGIDHDSARGDSLDHLFEETFRNGVDIGCGRQYETMVFITEPGNVCDTAWCNCGIPTHYGHNIFMRGTNTPLDAQVAHMTTCTFFAHDQESRIAKASAESGWEED